MENNMVNTGIYITAEQLAKLQRLAAALGVKRNRVVAMLIDSADEQVEQPKVRMNPLRKKKVTE